MNLCIVGTGYVGLVTGACFAEMGNTVTCVDNNPAVVARLEKGHIPIYEPGLEALVQRNFLDGRLHFTTEIKAALNDVQMVFITVGTPPRPDGSCDLSYVDGVAEEIGRYMTGDLVVVDKSTVPVGTADRVRAIIANQLAQRGCSYSFHMVSNPEFLKEGDAVNDFMKPDRVIVGTDNEEAAEAMRQLYAPFARSRDKLILMSVRSAEMTKYAANCMLATKISFINEIASICEKVGADVREVRNGIASDHRIGHHFIYPGIGYGGSCFPKDVKALIYTANEVGHSPALLAAVEDVNARQKLFMSVKVCDFFESHGGVENKTLAMWGLAFKMNTDDMREAPALSIIEALTQKGMHIQAFDPIAGKNAAKELKNNSLVTIVEEQYSALKGADALLVATEWNQFRNPDFKRIKEELSFPVIFDGRNLYSEKFLVAHGFHYYGIGCGMPGNKG